MPPLPEEEKISYLGIAKELAFLKYNPLYWYQYGPGMYSVSRGQIKLPFSGQTIQKLSRGFQRIAPKSKLAEALHKNIDLNTDNAILKSKELWWGLGSDKTRFKLGIEAVVKPGTFRPPVEGPATITRPLTTAGKKAYAKYWGVWTDTDIKRATRGKMTEYWLSRGPGSEKGFKAGLGMKGAPKVTTATTWGSAIGRGIAKTGVFALKGFAYYQVGKLMWDSINFLLEPMGRAAVQGIDTAFSAYEGISRPEMGGQLAMSYLTHGAATERQRALSAISKSHINGRSNFGKEASLFHRGF